MLELRNVIDISGCTYDGQRVCHVALTGGKLTVKLQCIFSMHMQLCLIIAKAPYPHSALCRIGAVLVHSGDMGRG